MEETGGQSFKPRTPDFRLLSKNCTTTALDFLFITVDTEFHFSDTTTVWKLEVGLLFNGKLEKVF